MVEEYLREIPRMLALHHCLIIRLRPLAKVTTGDGAFSLTQDSQHLHCMLHLEQIGKNCYPFSLRWGARNKATQQICGKLGLQMSCPKSTQGPMLSFLSQRSTQNRFEERRVSINTPPQEAPKSLMRVSQASLLEQPHCSLFAQRYLLTTSCLCTPVAAAPSISLSLVCSPNTIYYWLFPKVIQLRSQRSSHIAHKAVKNFFYGIVCHVFSPVCKGNNRMQ